jgi:hypothetical protein
MPKPGDQLPVKLTPGTYRAEPTLFDPPEGEGERRKADGIARVMANTPTEWGQLFDDTLALLAASGAPFTSEDVTALVGLPPPGTHRSAVGARMNAAARAGRITRVGYVQAKRANQHATVISEWKGTVDDR